MSWLNPGPNYGYRITQIDEHPWNTLITMKEIRRLDPGSMVFVGQIRSIMSVTGERPRRNYLRPAKNRFFRSMSPRFIRIPLRPSHEPPLSPTPFNKSVKDRNQGYLFNENILCPIAPPSPAAPKLRALPVT